MPATRSDTVSNLLQIKNAVNKLEKVRDALGSSIDNGETPSRELVRARLCELDFAIDSLKDYVYTEAK